MDSDKQATLADIANEIREIRAQQQLSASPWLTVSRAADYASVSDKTIRRLIAAGEVDAHRITSGTILIDRRQLDAAIQASKRRRGTRGRSRQRQ